MPWGFFEKNRIFQFFRDFNLSLLYVNLFGFYSSFSCSCKSSVVSEERGKGGKKSKKNNSQEGMIGTQYVVLGWQQSRDYSTNSACRHSKSLLPIIGLFYSITRCSVNNTHVRWKIK